jgi:streptomycin 6-kinase
MQIAPLFQKKIINSFGEEGKVWLASLETTVQTYLQKWELSSEGPVDNLSYNYVLKVRDAEGKPLILKAGVPNFDTKNEIRTLKAYNGRGCANLVKSDPANGVMLLERLVPGTMLSSEIEERQVVEKFIKVWKAIRRPVLIGENTPSITNWFEGLKRYGNHYPNNDGPISTEHIRVAEGFLKDVLDTSAGPELLHGDLHHENILFSKDHGWMVIDPKGVLGDPYFDVVSFLINQLDSKEDPKSVLRFRVDTLSEQLGFERKRLLKAAVALGTLYACWGIEDQDPDWEQTYQCVNWFMEFLK